MKYYKVVIEFLLVSVIGTMFYECKFFFAGTQLICKGCCSSIFIVNYDIWNVDFYSNLTLTRCIYQRIDENQESIWRLQPVSVWLGKCCYKNILWQYLSLLGNVWNANFFLVIKLWLVQLTATQTLWHILRYFTML